MKKISIIFVMLLFFLTSCKKNELITPNKVVENYPTYYSDCFISNLNQYKSSSDSIGIYTYNNTYYFVLHKPNEKVTDLELSNTPPFYLHNYTEAIYNIYEIETCVKINPAYFFNFYSEYGKMKEWKNNSILIEIVKNN